MSWRMVVLLFHFIGIAQLAINTYLVHLIAYLQGAARVLLCMSASQNMSR